MKLQRDGVKDEMKMKSKNISPIRDKRREREKKRTKAVLYLAVGCSKGIRSR